jgi:hypothetical protein
MAGRATSAVLWGFAVLAVPIALALAVVAIDVLRAPGQLTDDDRLFQTAPAREPGLWEVGFLRGDRSERLLGLVDDVSYRELVALYLEVEPGEVDWVDIPALESLRETVESELTRQGEEQLDAARRSRLLTLYGVLRLDARPTEDAEREAMARDAAAAFRSAIDLDPSNVEAMTNLESLLDVHGPLLEN